MDSSKIIVNQTANELLFVRTFDAPQALAFQAFATADHIKQWWGPEGWPVTKCTMDFRVGGVWHYCMQGPDGKEYWNKCVYREITEPERIIFTDSFADADGNVIDGMPPHTKTISFEEKEDTTTITTRITCASEEDIRALMALDMVNGYTNTLDNLERYLYNHK